MTLAAFDAKQFQRGWHDNAIESGDSRLNPAGFSTQLGAGVIIDNPDGFAKHYVRVSRDLAKDFKIDGDLPFFSNTHLKQKLGISKAISFADQLVTRMQKHITSVHYSYVILPPTTIPTVRVGGLQSFGTDIRTDEFIRHLGPMFSYLAAHSYLWSDGYQTSDLQVRMDAFRSKPTKAWAKLSDFLTPMVFTKGDECDPFISCADIMAFLTDAKLYGKYLKLDVDNIRQVWRQYDFDVTVQFFDKNSLHYYSWKGDGIIDIAPYLARPVVFLAIDSMELKDYDIYAEDGQNHPSPRRFNRVIRDSPVYDAALCLAFQKGGCLKLFSKYEDFSRVRDGDMFVYVGADSEKIGRMLQDAYDIHVSSGAEARKMIKKTN